MRRRYEEKGRKERMGVYGREQPKANGTSKLCIDGESGEADENYKYYI